MRPQRRLVRTPSNHEPGLTQVTRSFRGRINTRGRAAAVVIAPSSQKAIGYQITQNNEADNLRS